MSEVDEKEINKGIAEFMGESTRLICPTCKYGGYDYDNLYTRSIDALVPVVDRVPFSVCIYTLNGKVKVETPFGRVDGGIDELPKLAAGEIYKAIKALEGRE